jgi:hypothetical protein
MNSTDLVRQLRAARPTASPALREAVHAIAAREEPRRASLLTRLQARRRPLLVALPAAAAIAVVGAGVVGLVNANRPGTVAVEARQESAGLESSAGQPVPPNAYRSTPSPDENAAAKQSASGAFGATDAAALTPDASRAQRYFANVTLEVENTDALSDATQKAIQATKALGGYVVTASYGAAQTGTSSLTLRVPTDRVQDAIAQLTALGTIVSQQVQIDDLQASLDETGRRASVLNGRIATITAQLEGDAISAARRAQLEATRQSLRAELDELRRQANAVRGEARYATIQLLLQTAVGESATPAAPSRFDRGVDDAVAILAIEGLVAVYALVVLVPLGLAGAGLWGVVRALGRRERNRLLASS